MAFHPQTNRQIKYMNQKLKQYLRFFVDHRKKNWLEWLAIAGRQKTMELVTRNYQWPGVTRDIERYIEGCNIYQRIKNRTEEVAGKLKLSEVLEKLWTHLMVDFIMKLPLVAGKDTILVVYNRLSKMTHFVVTTEGTLVERLARLFRGNIQKLHRLPESVVLDRGPQFVTELTKKLNRMLEIKTKLSTIFYLQTDGQTK